MIKMENNYENIEPQNEQIYNLIQHEFQNENISDEIRIMVANKIKSTDFTAIGGAAKLTSAFGNGIYYMLGVVLVAGALSIYYFTSKNDNEKISDNSEISQIQNFDNLQTLQSSEANELIEQNSNQIKDESSIISNDNKIINKKSESETISIETQEYQHSQTIKINENVSDQFVSDSFIKIMNSLNLNFIEAKSNNFIIVKSKKVIGNFDNINVEFYITLKFSKIDRNKIIATLNYIESSDGNNNYDTKQLFYENLTSELQKLF